MENNNGNVKSLESWIRDTACSIRGTKDAPKYKEYILPLIFTKRLPGLIKGRLFFVNASPIFEKGDAKDFIPDGDILEQLGYGT